MRLPKPPATAPKPSESVVPETHVSNLWGLLTTIPRPHRLVDIPRFLPGTKEPIGQVAMWPLTHAELIESNAAAEQRMRSMFKDENKKDEINLGYHHSYTNELAVQHLWRASRDPSDLTKPVFPSPKAMSLEFTGDEIGVLYNHFLTTQAELGPITAVMSDEEYEAWVRRIAEAGRADPFDSLSWDLQRNLVVAMASQLHSYWTATSSAGSLPEESTQRDSEITAADSDPNK